MKTETLKTSEKKIFKFDLKVYHKLSETGLLPRNTELLHGVVYTKMTLSPIHRKIVNKLREIISRSLLSGYIVLQESPISIEDSEPEPDLSVHRGTYDDFSSVHPKTAELAIEVSLSSLEDDIQKAEIYAIAKIPQYWILDIRNEEIQIFQNIIDGNYSTRSKYNKDEIIPIPTTNTKIRFLDLL